MDSLVVAYYRLRGRYRGVILAFLFFINLVTSPGHWWVQWAALGIGIAWTINVFRLFRALLLVGGLAGLAAYLGRRHW